jgi:biopolymer transport protein TolR
VIIVKGKSSPASSDHPDKAIISMKHDRETSYDKYIEVQNELVAAYNFLREREAQRLITGPFQSMLDEKEKNQFSKRMKSLMTK